MRQRLLRWTGYLAVAILFAIACAFLSNWQFSRNDQKATEIALVQQNYHAKPITLDQAVKADGTMDASREWHPVQMRGHYLADEQVLVRNRPHGGTSAFEVLVPFQTDEGRVLLVDRGWVPPAEDSSPSTVAAPPAGEVTVVVRMRNSEPAPNAGRGAPPGQVPTIHLPTVAKQVNADLITGGYGQLASEKPSPHTAPAGFDMPTEDPGPHLSYAIQWILFAVMGFIFIFYVIRTEIIKAKEEAGERAPRVPRRRDKDADTEDALLDAASR